MTTYEETLAAIPAAVQKGLAYLNHTIPPTRDGKLWYQCLDLDILRLEQNPRVVFSKLAPVLDAAAEQFALRDVYADDYGFFVPFIGIPGITGPQMDALYTALTEEWRRVILELRATERRLTWYEVLTKEWRRVIRGLRAEEEQSHG
jgi:hypothetical protein